MTPEEFEGKIKSAATQLDHENDEHWTKGGEPDIATIAKLSGIDSLKRADIDKALPDFKRQERPKEVKGGKKVELKRETVASTANRAKVERMQGKEVKRNVDLFEPVENVLMRATAPGYYGGDLKQPGDIFRFTGRPGSWMEPA